MADYVEKYSSKASDELEKRIKRVYKQAAKEVQKKLDDFISGHKARNAKMLQMVADGQLSKQDYQKWMRGQVFQGDQWKQKLKDVTEVYVHADEKAREIVGGTSKNVFMEAANYTAYDLEKGLRGAVAFNVYDAKTVERLLKKDPKMLPEWKIDQPKDYTWNEKRVRNAVTQGIIQGESIEEVGERLTSELATSNAKKMDMFARTAVNGAQNAGRMDRLHEAEEMGIEVRKKWLATLDNRTRDTHQALDGQEQPIDEPFVVDGMKIDYPGDPLAPPELVYNCRCTLTYVYPKYQHLQHNHERRDQLNDKNIENMTYYEWVGLASKNDRKQEEPEVDAQRATFSNVKDFSEARSYFEETHGIKISKYVDELSFEQCKGAMSGIDDTINLFPLLNKTVNGIGVDDIGAMSSMGFNVDFNPKYWKGDRDYSFEYEYQCGAHEVGHCLERLISIIQHKDLEGGLWGKKARLASNEDWNNSTQSKRIVKQAIKNLKEKHPEFKNMSAREIRWSISDYALTNTSETLAEAVGCEMLRRKGGKLNYQYRGPIKHLFGEEIFSIIQKEIGEVQDD